MKKSILNLGKQLNKTEQKQINGGFGNLLISSSCYSQIRFCNAAMSAAIGNGANPTCTRCEPCTSFFGDSDGFQVRIYCE
ncbi:hypothetical protein [Tenacibaculum sp. M341]|uniref:hypothetical protein n=1 Tax=Tenacibaculum sp. M341 TaxID=2530339 RepID=UPI00104B8B0D|nr:hypothetical protein [Tenacibaculum sp. M341]TCI94210.1 hypothetical protein EYW44_02375 [Tenacibaculum sp. M341]